MRPLLIIMLSAACLALVPAGGGKITTEQRNEIIANTQLLNLTDITFEKISIRKVQKKYKQSKDLFDAIHKVGWVPPEELLLSHFFTKSGYLCVISYARISECDTPSDYYYLYVIDQDGNVKEPIEIRSIFNGYGMCERRFKFLSDSSIKLSITTNSEWAMDDNAKADTLFTNAYTINFLKEKPDTTRREHFEKILKPEER